MPKCLHEPGDCMQYYLDSLEEYTCKKAESKPKKPLSKKAGLFPEQESENTNAAENSKEDLEKKKINAKHEKNLLEEASNAQWAKL